MTQTLVVGRKCCYVENPSRPPGYDITQTRLHLTTPGFHGSGCQPLPPGASSLVLDGFSKKCLRKRFSLTQDFGIPHGPVKTYNYTVSLDGAFFCMIKLSNLTRMGHQILSIRLAKMIMIENAWKGCRETDTLGQQLWQCILAHLFLFLKGSLKITY